MSKDGALRAIQVTDSHLFEAPGGRLLGMETRKSLKMVLDLVAAEQPEFDLMLLTGDLSQDGSVVAYQSLRDLLQRFPQPHYWFPGNHDQLPVMRQVLGEDSPVLSRVVRKGAWQIVLLNSTIPGKVPGRLDPEELDWLEQCLNEAPDRHALVSFHHQPVPIGCRWLDSQMVANADDLFAVLDRHDQVRGVLWGHVHQEFDRERNGVRLLATPSTCVQFTPASEDFAVDSEPPGYRWLQLGADGSIETGVRRVEPIDFEIDYSIKGY